MATIVVAGCGSNEPAGSEVDAGTTSTAPPAPPTFSVGGTVKGLLGTGLVLQNNLGDDIPIAKDGSFSFGQKQLAGAKFSVSIMTQPTAPSQTCTVSGESGTIASDDVTSILVNCTTDKFSVGGTVSGVAGRGLVLQNNGGDDFILGANGTFAFPEPIASGSPYAITVKTQPTSPTQTCTVTNGAGTMGGAKVADVAIACTTNTYTISGTVSGLAGTGLVLQSTVGNELPITANGPFVFPAPIASGITYGVAVKSQPSDPMQVCVVSGGTGTMVAGDVTGVAVNCTNKYSIGGTVTGLAGTVYLQNNAGNDLMLNANGTFAFSTPLSSGATYAVTVRTQPYSPIQQICTLSNRTGTVGTSHITDIALNCVTSEYKVKGTVSGLAAGAKVVLQNKNADDLSITANGAFTFATSVPSGQTYAVTVKTPPTSPSQTCTVTNGTGTITTFDMSNVTVACVTDKFTVGGSVAGLTGTGLVLQNNLGDNLSVNAPGGSFTFATPIASGQPYSVTVKTQPTNPSQTCTVDDGSGTVGGGNVANVTVTCVTD